MIEGDSILDEAVATLLRRESDVQVSDVAYADDTTFLQDISRIRPDVILLNADGPLDSVRILDLLKDLPSLASLRVIVVRPEDNLIDMVEMKRVVATQSDDLLGLIRRDEDRA
jgi:hypothetical protein